MLSHLRQVIVTMACKCTLVYLEELVFLDFVGGSALAKACLGSQAE